MSNRKIIVVEDHEDMRELYKVLFRRHPDIEIFEAENGEEALELLGHNPTDLAIVDISLPGMSGIELSRQISRTHPGMRILIVTGHEPGQYSEEAQKAGADDLVSKNSAFEIVSHAIRLLDTHHHAET
jgi:DNA-binding NarL/FixJ family response regulator